MSLRWQMVTGKPEHGGPRTLFSWSLFPTICGQDCWRRAVSSSSRLQGYGLCDENCFRYLWSTPRVFRLGEDQSIMDPPYRRGFCFKVARAVLLWVTPASHQSPDDCSSVHYFFFNSLGLLFCFIFPIFPIREA